MPRPLKARASYTTGEAARLLDCAPRTVTNLCEAGDLAFYRLPRSNDRRIHHASLVALMAPCGLALGPLDDTTRLLVLEPRGGNGTTGQMLSGQLREVLAEGWAVEAAHCGFEAGALLGAAPAQIVVLDFAVGRSDCLEIARAIGKAHPSTLVIGLAGEDEADVGALTANGVGECFQKPFDTALLAERLVSYREGR